MFYFCLIITAVRCFAHKFVHIVKVIVTICKGRRCNWITMYSYMESCPGAESAKPYPYIARLQTCVVAI